MRKPNLMCLIALLTLSSCEENGTPATESWVIIVVFIVIFIIVMIHENIKSGKVNEEAKAKGDDPHSYKEIGTYIGGHPSVDKQKTYVLARKNDQVIEFWEGIMGYNGEFSSSHPDKIEGFEIPIEAVEDIRIEDKTSIEREVGAGRMFLVGMYAFAWKKKKKNEMAFVVIKWKKGKFENETLFAFEGKGSVTKANTARNELIKMCE